MNIEISTLKNGLRIVSQTRKDIETVSVGVWVNTGTCYETKEMNGISHFLEHMFFKGTKNRSSIKISEDMENVGGHMNAYTSREFTAFYAKVLKNDAELAMDVLTDILVNSLFLKEEIIKEHEVVTQEIKQAFDTPDDIVFDYLQEKAYPDQPWGRPVLGPEKNVRSFGEKALRDYIKTNYAASNMVVCAVGNIKHVDLVKMAEQRLGGLQKKTNFVIEKPNYVGGFSAHKRAVEQAQITFAFEGINYHDPEYYSNVLMSSIFGGGMSSRLFRELRENRGLVYTTYSYINAQTQTGLDGIYAGAAKENLGKLIPVVADEIKKMRNEKVSEEELKRAKTQTKASILMGLESSSTTADIMARQMLIYGRVLPTKEIVERIEKVDFDAVQKMANRIFSSKPTCALLGAIEGHPTYKAIEKWMKL